MAIKNFFSNLLKPNPKEQDLLTEEAKARINTPSTPAVKRIEAATIRQTPVAPKKNFFSSIMGNSFTVTPEPEKIKAPPSLSIKPTTPKYPGLREGLKMAETRGEKEPYSFYRYSGDPKLGDALGAYQITEGQLKTYGKRYLGREVSRDEFLDTPELQDKYVDNFIDYWDKQGIDEDNIIVIHRGGINAKTDQYQSYIDSVKSMKPTQEEQDPVITPSTIEPENPDRPGFFTPLKDSFMAAINTTKDAIKDVGTTFKEIPKAAWRSAYVAPASESKSDMFASTIQTLLGLPEAVAISLFGKPVLDFAATIKETKDDTAEGTKYTIPGRFGGQGVVIQGANSLYYDSLMAGQNHGEAFTNSMLKVGADLSFVVPIAMGLSRMAVTKYSPEALLKQVEISRKTVGDILAGRNVSDEVYNAFRSLTPEQKVAAAKGFIDKMPTPEPSIIGKVFGLTKEEAQVLFNQAMNLRTNVRPVPRLPGYRERAGQAPAAGLSTRQFERVGGAVDDIVPVQEAKKYASADEYIKAYADQDLFKAGSPEDIVSMERDGFKLKDKEFNSPGISFTTDPKTVQGVYGNSLANAYLSKDAKIIKLEDALKETNTKIEGLSDAELNKAEDNLIYWAKENGYDGIDLRSARSNVLSPWSEIRIFNPGIVKTRSQLTDQWNKASQPTPEAVAIPKPAPRKPLPTGDTLDSIVKEMRSEELTNKKIPELEARIDALEESMSSSGLKTLEKYVARSGQFKGQLPEVTGGGKYVGSGTSRAPGETRAEYFKRRGDDLVTELGYKDAEQAREAFTAYKNTKEQLNVFKGELREAREILAATRRGEKLMTMARGDRRKTFRAIKEFFGLTDAELAEVRSGRDYVSMTRAEFENFIQEARSKAEKVADRRQAQAELETTITEKELIKVDNIQKALKLPTIQNMTPDQLRAFSDTLDQFKTGDEFLSVRKLETVDKTDLQGIKTIREAKERLAQELGVDVSVLDNIKVSALDRYRYDTSLAERNPFYGLMVDSTNKAILNAEARYLAVEEEINRLINAARASRRRGVVGQFVPQDKEIFQWLESPESVKKTLQLTRQELEAAEYIQKQYAEMRDYLIQQGTLKKYREDYITHINRGFLETWKEDGLLDAFKNVFRNYQREEAVFNIVSDTGQVLPLEKFFQFSMRRTGGVEPTKNVADAFLSYLKAFEKKAALDSVIPKLDIYAHSLTPRTMTPRGLEFDRSLKTFVNEWLNTKKGRTAKIVGVEQGGKIDLLLRAGKAFTTILDLGLNIPVGIAARFGENMTNFINMGSKKYALGLLRARTPKGKAIVRDYKNFVGRSPFTELFDARKGLGDKLADAAFGLFQDATVRSNKTFLLGSLTDAEFKAGKVSGERLAEIKREMGRYRVVDGAKSVVESTSVGGIMTQYKSWAIPPLRTTRNNILKIIKNPKLIKSREGQELLRGILSTLAVVFLVKAFVGDDEDDSFLGTLLNKAYRDAMTLTGALDPATITSEPRFVSFISDIGTALSQIVKLEEYSSGSDKAGELKGDDALLRVFTPRAIKQFIPKETKATIPSLFKNSVPKLYTPPPIPKLNK